MKLNIVVDLDDVYSDHGDESFNTQVKDIIKEEIFKQTRKAIATKVSEAVKKVVGDAKDPKIAELIKEAKRAQLLKALEALK